MKTVEDVVKWLDDERNRAARAAEWERLHGSKGSKAAYQVRAQQFGSAAAVLRNQILAVKG